MKTTEITNSEDIIDSRDVIARIEYLEYELQDAYEGEFADENENKPAFSAWLKEASEDSAHTLQDAAQELIALQSLAEESGGYAADWQSGEALIRDSYFKEYAEQLAEDLGAIDLNAVWPNTCIDWDRAARELQQDYTSVDFDGVTYWIR